MHVATQQGVNESTQLPCVIQEQSSYSNVIITVPHPSWSDHRRVYIYLRQGWFFVVVCLFVCLLVTLHKNFRTDLH